ncbi:hypothetical protein CYMTET_44419 [Cymbomonas tetramitiformis]|uniref:DNA methylase N-4/N-6 domain-containing protein n=1 Tax=Cymbomonas tetramitiformis TaxID=36881 RepID=A0AAE0C1G3_9CHLO|nr:hypothetical protein CYMTET_44419 [Cymbomonas tetramitiformis]
MSQVATPSEARKAAEVAACGWHAKLKVEHASKMEYEEKAELCKQIEMEHRWPNPMDFDEAAEQGSVFRLPIKCLYHATGYEACRDQERGWVNEIKSSRKENPWAPFNAGLVAIDDVKTRAEFSLKKALRGGYRGKVFGHQHCYQATDECHEEIPAEIAFAYFESKIYIGLTPDMIRFLGEMQNMIDQKQKGKDNTQFMQGLRSTLFEKHGVVYKVYREALISEFVASVPEDTERGTPYQPGYYEDGGLGFQYMEKRGTFENEENPEGDPVVELTMTVLNDDIDAHLDRVTDWYPVMSHLNQSMETHVKEVAMSKHQVLGGVQINHYFMHWTIANFRPQTWALCVSIMEAYRRFDLKGMKNPLASKTKKRKASSSPAKGPAKKSGKKGTSNRQIEDEVQRGGGDHGAGSSRGAGILVEEAHFLHNAKSMGMTFWINLGGLAGEAEFDKVDTYLRQIINKDLSVKEGDLMISQFKKERMVQKHLVSAAGLETWDEFKDEFTLYWSSQEKIESLIGCLPSTQGGARRGGAGEVPHAILNYVENARANLKEAQAPSAAHIQGLQQIEVKVDIKLYREARTDGPEAKVAGEAGLEDDEPTHQENVPMLPRWKIVKGSMNDMKDVPRLPFTGTIIDCNYELDKEKTPDAMTKKEVQPFLESFNAKTTSPAWTVAIFCGFAQQNDFLEVIDNYCSGRAERFFWHKANVHMNPNKSVRYNDVECGVLGYHVKSDAQGESSKKPEWVFNFDLGDGERYSRASLLRGFPVVHQMFKREGKVVNNHQKPLALLMELIQCHMLGDNPGKTDENGHPLNWILDACCGVGSTSMAAMRCGMNAIGFDHDQYMVSSAQQRLTNFDAEPDQKAETEPKTKSEPTAKGKEAATAESEEDDLDGNDADDNDA